VRSRTRRRWATRAGLAMAALALALVLAGVVLVRTLTMVSEGEPPAIDAWAPAIPAGMLDTLRAAGVDPAAVRYVYAPHGRDMRAALVLTRDSLVVVRDGRARAWSMLDDDDVRIDLRRQGDLGLLVVTEHRRADTVYVGMSGLEQQVLLLAIKRVTTRPDSATAP
jgi:RecB family exonuclease